MSFSGRFRSLFRRQRLEHDMAEEMRAHLEEQTARNRAAGMSPADARAAAHRQFGGVAQIQERARAARSFKWLDEFAHDLRLGWRGLRRQPGFTLVAAGTLALGIGACTGVFSVVDSLLLRPIGHDAHTEREIQIFETRGPGRIASRVAPANFYDWLESTTSFEAIRAGAGANLVLTGTGEPLRLTAGRATYQLLGAHAWTLARGRGFLPEEDAPGRNRVLIVGHAFWQRVLGGDPDVLGRRLLINGEPHEVVGVLSEVVSRFLPVDAFVPMALTDEERMQRDARSLSVWARLKPGVSLAAAQAEMDVLAERLARAHPESNAGWGASLVPVTEMQGAGGLRAALWTLLAAVACVLLIGCANVANLLLARSTARRREMTVRAALGAGRGRLVRQLLAESLLLALLGGAGGVVLAHLGLRAVQTYAGPGMERLGFLHLNLDMLALAVGLSMVTGIVFGLAPAWFAARLDLNRVLQQGTRGSSDSRATGRLRQALVVAEIALALVLLAGSGALVRRLAERAQHDPGFAPDGLIVLQVNLPRAKYPQAGQQRAFADAVLARLAALPGVRSASATTALPLAQNGVGFEIEGQPPTARSAWPHTSGFAVTPGHLATLGIRVVRGRGFSTLDDAQAGSVALINETLARQFFAGENPIGRRIRLATGGEAWREIVGLVADVTQFGDTTTVGPQVYEPFAQAPGLNLSFVVRASGETTTMLSALKPQMYAVDPNQPVLFMRELPDLLDDRIAGQRFAMHLLTAFSLIGLLIAAIGTYAVIAYVVSQRTREIGIRVALGAQARDVRRLVLKAGIRMVGWGLLLGICATLAGGRVVASLLYQVEARDPLTLGAITLILAAVAGLASWLPARRAAKVDPIVALRSE